MSDSRSRAVAATGATGHVAAQLRPAFRERDLARPFRKAIDAPKSAAAIQPPRARA
ncbi:MAG: hypothetical protein HY332_04965 [Chloroflexi bacterium]|nr:hypothetical protein [Chloroflexota bacterium]